MYGKRGRLRSHGEREIYLGIESLPRSISRVTGERAVKAFAGQRNASLIHRVMDMCYEVTVKWE